jgi:glycosyltransferase involved in cell wall biosynthesis
LMCPKRTLRRGDEICVDGRGLRCLTCPSVEQGTAKRVGLAGLLAVTGRRTYAQVDRLLAVSTYVGRRYLEAGIPASALEIVPNFLDPGIAGAVGTDPGEANDVLFVGPASPHKGREVLEEAFKEMGRTGFRVVLVGDDDASNASPEPGVVRFGRLEGDRLWARFREAAVVVVPSTWAEPCPTVALEAMAFQRPVVASAIGGLPDIVEDGRTGVLVPPGDPRALAGALTRLAADPPARTSMGREGRLKLEASFSSATVVPRIEAAYRAAMGERRS